MEKKVNSVNLYDEVSIETWIRIVDGVLQMNISDSNNSKEFSENLRILKKVLEGTEVSLEEKGRYAKHFFHVGLATLLQSIYDMPCDSNKKECFAEQIYSLKKLGIGSVQFDGNSSQQGISSLGGILVDSGNSNISYIHKIFTDGSFCIENEGGYTHQFNMTKLENFNYYLYVIVKLISNKDQNFTISSLKEAKVTLSKFDGTLPSKEEIERFGLPQIQIDSNPDEWQVTNGKKVKQIFNPYTKKI